MKFLRLFGRKIQYLDCGCPNAYTKNDCLSWWAFGYRCFLKTKRYFDVQSAINFLRSRQSFNPTFERNQFLMFNTYKEASFQSNNRYVNNMKSVEFTNEEKDAFSEFYDKFSSVMNSILNFKVSFVNKLKIKVRNTLNGVLDFGKMSFERKNGLTSIETDQIILSFEFLPFLFWTIKDKLRYQSDDQFKIAIPSLKLIGKPDKNDPIGSIEIKNINIDDQGFSIESISNFDQSFVLSNVVANDSRENKLETESIAKRYLIKIDESKLTTENLFNLLFYRKNKNDNFNLYNSSAPNINIHNFFSFLNLFEYVIVVSKVSLLFNNDDSLNCLTFKFNYVNSFESVVIGLDEIKFGEIFQEFVLAITILYDFDGQKIFFDLNSLKMSLFSSEIPILINLLNGIKPLVFRSFKLIPYIRNLNFNSKGFKLTLETPECTLVKINIAGCKFESSNGFGQFSINNNQALFYDRKLNKWCVLIQPFSISSSFQRQNIELSVSFQFNFTSVFFNDIIKYFTSNDARVDLHRKIKVENLAAYSLHIQELNRGETAKNGDLIKEEEDDVDDENNRIKLNINENTFLNSKKFRVEVEGKDDSYSIDSSHLQFPLYISNNIVLSKGENSVCFCSPFVLINKTDFKNICVYQISKNNNANNNNNNENQFSLVGRLDSRGSKLGICHPNILLTGKTDEASEIFSNISKEMQMLSVISSTFDKKPQLFDIILNGCKETILVFSEFNYEKGALFIRLMNPFVFVNQVPECKSISLSLISIIENNIEVKEKKKRNAQKNPDDKENEPSVIKVEINEILPLQKASLPINMIPSCSLFFQNQQPKTNPKAKIVNNSFDVVVKLNDLLGNTEQSTQSDLSHIVVSEDFKYYPIHFSEGNFNFSLALKVEFNPRKGNWSLIIFSPSVIENKTDLNISINSFGKEKTTSFFTDENKSKKILFGCYSFFNSRSMPVFVGYSRLFKISEKPIDLCFSPFSSQVMLPSINNKNCYLPLLYKTTSKTGCYDKYSNVSTTVIDYYKIIENLTIFDFVLTPIDEISDQNEYASFNTNTNDNDNDKTKNKKKKKSSNIDNKKDEKNEYPAVLYKKGERKPILLSTSSFCFKFEYKETVLPICLLKDNYRTCIRVDQTLFVLLTITEKVARFEMSDFSPEKTFMTFTNLLPNDFIFINSSTSQPPLRVESNTTTLFGYDSPFESTNISLYAFGEEVDFRPDRCYEPLLSPMNKFTVQTVSKQANTESHEIVHSIVVKMVSSSFESKHPNPSLPILPPVANNLDSGVKDLTLISIKKDSIPEFESVIDSSADSFITEDEDDPVVNSQLMSQFNDKLNNSYDIDDYESFIGYSLTVNVPIFEISLIDDRLSELALICLYQSSLKLNHDLSMTTKTIQFSIKSLQVFDMNIMTLFPTVVSSNPENANFLSAEISYFDRMTVDQFKLSISPILISPDINFLNELYYFFRKINVIKDVSLKSLSQSKMFNLIQIDPTVIVLNIKAASSRNLNAPKYVTFNKNLTNSFALNGFIIHNADISPLFFLGILEFSFKVKMIYSKIFYIQSSDEAYLSSKSNSKQKGKADQNPNMLIDFDKIDERIIIPAMYQHLFNFPSLNIDPLIEKNLKDKPAKILDALSQTESYFKLASDKMRLISNDKIDRDKYLIPHRKKRSQALSSSSSSNASSGGDVQGSVKKEKSANAAQTVANGFSSAAKSFGSGITGIFRKPIEGGKENGAKGAFKGIGQGLLGVLTCTVSSVIEVGSGIAGGIRKSIIKDNTSNYEQCRPPSTFLLRCISTNSANSTDDNINYVYIDDINKLFDNDIIEAAEEAQQVINCDQYVQLQNEKEENLLFFSKVAQNPKRIAFLGITEFYLFLFNSNMSILNKFDLSSITWFKTKFESLSNNSIDSSDDDSLKRKIEFDVFNQLSKKSIRYEVEIPSENQANLAVQFLTPKLRVLDIIRDEM